MLLPHICLDIDGMLTYEHVHSLEGVTLDNIKGGLEMGELMNRAANEAHLSITTYKICSQLTKAVMLEAGFEASNFDKTQLAMFMPKHPELLGKNLHCKNAAQRHGISMKYPQVHILMDDNENNCQLFERQIANARALTVNGDLSHIDILRQVLDNPAEALETVEEASRRALDTRNQQKFFVR